MSIEIEKEKFAFSDIIIDSYKGIELPPQSCFSKIVNPFSEVESFQDFREKTKTKNLKLITSRESRKQRIWNITREKGTCSINEAKENKNDEVNSKNKFINTFKYVMIFSFIEIIL